MELPKLNVIVTGVTGMVGEGVLNECLISPRVGKILIVSRKPSGIVHPKITELLHNNFLDLSPISEKVSGYDGCFFCLGVSSVGMKKEEYERMTYDLTMGFAGTLKEKNNDMTFCYVSGAGTDSTEKGKLHWARVKGKTENDLQKLGFKGIFLFRPGILAPTPGLKNTLGFYRWFGWLIPLIRALSPNSICSLTQLGKAMINVSLGGYETAILEVKDIRKAAEL